MSGIANSDDFGKIVGIASRTAWRQLEDIDVWMVTAKNNMIARTSKCRVVVLATFFSVPQNSAIKAAAVFPAMAHHAVLVNQSRTISSGEEEIGIGGV